MRGRARPHSSPHTKPHDRPHCNSPSGLISTHLMSLIQSLVVASYRRMGSLRSRPLIVDWSHTIRKSHIAALISFDIILLTWQQAICASAISGEHTRFKPKEGHTRQANRIHKQSQPAAQSPELTLGAHSPTESSAPSTPPKAPARQRDTRARSS